MKIYHLSKILASFILVGFLFSYSSSVQAQDATTTATKTAEQPIVIFSYMKTKTDDYIKVEKEIWQPYMKSEIKNGRMLFWAVYDVEFPGGKNVEYDFVTINVFSGMEQMENAWVGYEERMKKIHPKLDLKKLDVRTNASRDLVWNEAFRVVTSAVSNLDEAAEVIVVNRMQSKPDKYNDYIRMETNIFQPAHNIAVKKGHRKNWHFLSRAMPYGDEYGYDFITIDSYDSMVQMAKATPANVWRDAHPDKDIEAMWEEINPAKMRTLKRGETWRNVMYANGTDQKTIEK